jgi:hypothetical protein
MNHLRVAVFAFLMLASVLAVNAAVNSYADFQKQFSDPAALDASVPSNARSMLGTNSWLIIVGGAGTDYFWVDTVNGRIVASGRGRRFTPAPTAVALTTKQSIEGILNSPDRAKATTQAIRDGRILIQYRNGGGLQTQLLIGAAKLGFLPGQLPQGLKEVGEVCAHGGECITGNCVGVGQGPPWTYQCSCDPFRFATTGPQCR